MRDLVVADGECTAAERVEHLTKRARSHAQKPRLAKHAIQQDRPAHVDMAVFTDDPYARPDLLGGIEDRGTGIVQLAHETGHVATGWAETLRVVIQVRQVNQAQLGPISLENLGRAAGDPLRAGEAGTRSPEGVEREAAEVALEPLAQPLRARR